MSIDIKGPSDKAFTSISDANKSRQEESIGAPTQQGNGRSSNNSDTVTLTSMGSHIHNLAREVSELPVVDVERVAAIKESMMNGTYKMDPTSIAEKMLQLETAIDR